MIIRSQDKKGIVNLEKHIEKAEAIIYAQK